MNNEIIENIEQIDENEDIIQNWEPLEFELNEHYQYVSNNLLFNIISDFIYYLIAFPILTIVCKIVLGLRIKGRQNIKNITTGAVTISNHIHYIDCAMLGIACIPNKVFFTTNEGNFKIPFVRHLIKLLNAIPIPKEVGNKKRFSKQIDKLLKEGEIVQFYPEASLWPYYDKIRSFKDGAFKFAVKNEVPIIPIVYTYREAKGLWSILKSKPLITLNILEPIYPDDHLDIKERVQDLKEKAYKEMKKCI